MRLNGLRMAAENAGWDRHQRTAERQVLWSHRIAGQDNDNYGWLFVQGDPIRIYIGTNCHADMLVPRLSISRSG
jgi:hypothetical protein